jgi:hypothetical protein
MDEAIEQLHSLLRQADVALSRQAQSTRTPKERDDDFAEAQRAHRHAVAIIDALRSREIDEAMVSALAPLQIEVADLSILLSEIRFDEAELAYRIPRLRSADV